MSSPHKARKRFGQNFLHDAGVIQQILHCIQPQAGQTLVEIGPGQGALTRGLLQQCGQLIAIELDRDLIAPLQRQTSNLGQLQIIQQDVLTVDFNPLALPHQKLRIVGNLPYNISTPLLFHLFDFMPRLEDIHVMLQKEVVERMAAAPGNKIYGRLSVMVQYHCQVIPLLLIKPQSFSPAPSVDSMLVRLIPHHSPPVAIDSLANFQQVVSHAFSQRRKTLGNALQNLISREQIKSQSIDPSLRAEQLDLAAFARLSQLLPPLP